MERRLAAILAADVVGYSRLMEANETATFEQVRAHRKELFEPEIEKHHGRIFKLMGDGLLAEFASVVDAVECAVALQRGMAERNEGLADGQRIDIRMGINLGDVIVEGDDRHGEGVVIAARLQQLAEPGGIAVSQMVAENVKHKLALRFEPVGKHNVKNIAEPISVYRVVANASVANPIGSKGHRTAWIMANGRNGRVRGPRCNGRLVRLRAPPVRATSGRPDSGCRDRRSRHPLPHDHLGPTFLFPIVAEGRFLPVQIDDSNVHTLKRH